MQRGRTAVLGRFLSYNKKRRKPWDWPVFGGTGGRGITWKSGGSRRKRDFLRICDPSGGKVRYFICHLWIIRET